MQAFLNMTPKAQIVKECTDLFNDHKKGLYMFKKLKFKER